jgi:hypothetical protein
MKEDEVMLKVITEGSRERARPPLTCGSYPEAARRRKALAGAISKQSVSATDLHNHCRKHSYDSTQATNIMLAEQGVSPQSTESFSDTAMSSYG